jgi:hypothetical protein
VTVVTQLAAGLSLASYGYGGQWKCSAITRSPGTKHPVRVWPQTTTACAQSAGLIDKLNTQVDG